MRSHGRTGHRTSAVEASSQRWHWIGLVGALWLTACPPPAPTQPAAHSAAPPAGGSQSPPSSTPPAPAIATGGDQSTGRSPLEVAARKPFQLHLPTDAPFVEQALPRQNVARYASFVEKARIDVGHGYLHQLDLLDDSGVLLVSSDDEATVRLYDSKTRRLLANLSLPGNDQFQTAGVAAWPEQHAGGPWRFVAATEAGVALVTAVGSGELVLLDNNPAHRVTWSNDGNVLVTGTSDVTTQTSVLRFFARQGDSLSELRRFEFSERVDGWDLSRDNRLLAVSHYPSGDFRVIDLHQGADLLRLPGPEYAGSIAFSPDGRYLAVGGAALVLVDLANPARRAHYGYFNNNIDTVRFSPSGDALVTSSYDGRVRVFAFESVPLELPVQGSNAARVAGLELRLLRELAHAGRANVYEFVFEADGDGLWSGSGDRTLRWFRGRSPAPDVSVAPSSFRSVEQWRQAAPEAAPWPAPPEPQLEGGHWVPDPEAPVRPSRLVPGKYACKLGAEYRLRDCWVDKDERGRSWLEFDEANLIGLRGLVYDDGPVVRYAGWLTAETNLVGCRGCERQPIHGVFRGSDTSLKGIVTFRNYYDPYVAPPLPKADAKVEDASDRYSAQLRLVERGAVRPTEAERRIVE